MNANIVIFINWSLGQLSGITWERLCYDCSDRSCHGLHPVYGKAVSAYQLGEVYAANMGVNIRRFRLA